jgi:hypothetical protein
MTNENALELFQTLNSIPFNKGSHQEFAGTKTLRKMKAWSTSYNEKIRDLEDEFCATHKSDKGVELLLKKALKRTNKDGSTEEYQVNEYTADGNKKKVEAIRKYLAEEVKVPFEIHATSDAEGLTAYQLEILTDHGFYKPRPTSEGMGVNN